MMMMMEGRKVRAVLSACSTPSRVKLTKVHPIEQERVNLIVGPEFSFKMIVEKCKHKAPDIPSGTCNAIQCNAMKRDPNVYLEIRQVWPCRHLPSRHY